MPYGPHTPPLGPNLSLALPATSPMAQACVARLVAQGLGAATPEAWRDAYRRAYEQARAALAPSRFQLLARPSWN